MLRSSFFIASKIQLNLSFLEYFLDSSVTLTLCLHKPQLRLTPLYVPWAESSNVGQKFWPALSLRIISPADESLLLPACLNCLSHGWQPQENLACIPSCSLLSTDLGKHHAQAPSVYLVSPFWAHLPSAGNLLRDSGSTNLDKWQTPKLLLVQIGSTMACMCITSREMPML